MKSKTVLIVDDNALNRRIFENIVGQTYLFEVAENGKQAIEKIKNNKYDLVLMDIQMPELDGISTIKFIKENRMTSTPIVAISAYANANDRDYFLSAGFDDFIAKPVKPTFLLETITQNIHKKSKEPSTSEIPVTVPNTTLDPEVYNQLIKYNSRENIATVYADFLEESHRLLSEIEFLIKNENFDEIGEKLHIIKGNSGTLGAMGIYYFANEFEKNIKNNNFDNTYKDYIYLADLINDFKNHLHSKQII
jgi:CheY-like chemotaxis protein/HPt (histidine-containing phosphotransfer) domain-containing protein